MQKLYPVPDELALQSILKDMKIAVDKFESDLMRTEGADAKRTKYDPVSLFTSNVNYITSRITLLKNEIGTRCKQLTVHGILAICGK